MGADWEFKFELKREGFVRSSVAKVIGALSLECRVTGRAGDAHWRVASRSMLFKAPRLDTAIKRP